ncbi:stress-responsive transcription factor hsf1 [Mortierella antarctica]|nr:stress-responsive transcription factor hsf1 [Mortierella antarctica]
MPPASTVPDRNSSSSAFPLISHSLHTTLALPINPGLGINSNNSNNSSNQTNSNKANSNKTNGSALSQATHNTMPNANNMLVNGRGSSGSVRSGASKPPGGSSSSASLQQLPRPSSTARGNVAAFLTKLYNMVGDEASNNLIKWSEDGQSFIVVRHVEFAKEVLPKFFKHNNFSSFVRQLNMYGFHKVPHLQQGVLLPDVDSEEWEFSNPHFQKNQPDLLCLVSRKKASNGSEDKDALTMDLGHILTEVTAIKKHQIAISSDLKNIERDHQSLWQESIAARERHQRQQDTIDKILRFLASVFSGEKKRAIVPNKKPRLTITEGDVEDEYEHENSLGSGGEHEEEVTKLLGSKRKRASMVQSEADYILPGMESQGSPSTKPTFNISEMTPATLALLANANQSAQTKSAPSFVTPTSTTASTSNTATSLATSLASNSNGLPTASAAAAAAAAAAPLPDYLGTAFPGLNYSNLHMQQGQQLPFKLDASNLSIPTTLLPNAMISPAHHDMLRSISMANAQESNPAPLPPSFVQTPAGANVVKGVDQIAREMEQLQKSIEALEAHGLDVNDFHFDESYLDPASFDSSGYHHLGNISESGIPYQDDPLGSESDAMTDLIQLNADQDELNIAMDHQHLSSGQITPVITTPSRNSSLPSTPYNSTIPSQALSSPTASSPAASTSVSSPTVGATPVSSTVPATPKETPPANPRTPTVGEEYLEDLLELDAT